MTNVTKKQKAVTFLSIYAPTNLPQNALTKNF